MPQEEWAMYFGAELSDHAETALGAAFYQLLVLDVKLQSSQTVLLMMMSCESKVN